MSAFLIVCSNGTTALMDVPFSVMVAVKVLPTTVTK
jgi:hypothetical protein